jgi:large subunit ribosomal protein L10e
MGLRPGRCYRNTKKAVKGNTRGGRGHRSARKQKRSYTRVAVKVPRRNYIGAAPALRIRQFNMGNPKGKYNQVADLIVREGFDLRDNAIEAVRMTVNRKLVKDLGKDAFFMKVRVYPSNILRENKAAQGAGADRVSQGMSMSFGKPVGRASRLRDGQVVYSVLCTKSQKKIVKEALMRAKAKFPVDVEVVFHDDIKSVGTIPSSSREEKRIEATEETTEEGKEEKKDGKTDAKKDDKSAEKKDGKTDTKKEEKKK